MIISQYIELCYIPVSSHVCNDGSLLDIVKDFAAEHLSVDKKYLYWLLDENTKGKSLLVRLDEIPIKNRTDKKLNEAVEYMADFGYGVTYT